MLATAPAPAAPRIRRPRPGRWRAAGTAGPAAWAALVTVAVAWGSLRVAGTGVALRAAPFAGHWRWHGGLGLAPAAALGAAVVAWGPGLVGRLPARRLAAATGATAAAWAAALAAADGWDRITAPLTTRHEYERYAARVGDLGAFLHDYVDRLPTTPVHVQGHPPGPVLLAWALDHAGLGGAGWLAAVALAGWGVAAAGSLTAAHVVAGPAAARRAAPALAVLPAAVWAGTSVDAVFAGLAATTVALAALAAVSRGRRAVVAAAAAGVAAGVALLATYGAVPFVGIALVLLVVMVPAGGRARPAAAFAAGAGAVLGAAALAGFWWPAGLAATSGRYWAGVGAVRPAAYTTLLGNPAVLALAVGPAAAAVAAGRRWAAPRRALLLPGLALAAVAAADLSQMARGEVERIWLPFVPLLALALPGRRRGVLAAQVATALVLQAVLASPW